MAIVPNIEGSPVYGFTLTLPDANTTVHIDDTSYGQQARPLPHNCRGITLYNLDSANRVLVRFAPLSEIGVPLTLGNSIVLPQQSALSLSIGYVGDRGPVGLLAGTSVTPPMHTVLLRAETGSNVQVTVTYLQGRGSSLV